MHWLRYSRCKYTSPGPNQTHQHPHHTSTKKTKSFFSGLQPLLLKIYKIHLQAETNKIKENAHPPGGFWLKLFFKPLVLPQQGKSAASNTMSCGTTCYRWDKKKNTKKDQWLRTTLAQVFNELTKREKNKNKWRLKDFFFSNRVTIIVNVFFFYVFLLIKSWSRGQAAMLL